MDYQDINKRIIDSWIKDGWRWGQPIDHETFVKAKAGNWDVLLTPTKTVPHEWLGNLKNKKILGLAAGGGQQIPVFAALGAECYVLDYSSLQIASELFVARREGYVVNALEADMTKTLPYESNFFDLIFFPVANCYVNNAEYVFKEAYRVLKKGGILLSGLTNEVLYFLDDDGKAVRWSMPFNPLQNEEAMKYLKETDGGVQFSHSLEEQIGGQLRAGFKLIDIYEDTNGTGKLHDMNIKTFLATKSLK